MASRIVPSGCWGTDSIEEYCIESVENMAACLLSGIRRWLARRTICLELRYLNWEAVLVTHAQTRFASFLDISWSFRVRDRGVHIQIDSASIANRRGILFLGFDWGFGKQASKASTLNLAASMSLFFTSSSWNSSMDNRRQLAVRGRPRVDLVLGSWLSGFQYQENPMIGGGQWLFYFWKTVS